MTVNPSKPVLALLLLAAVSGCATATDHIPNFNSALNRGRALSGLAGSDETVYRAQEARLIANRRRKDEVVHYSIIAARSGQVAREELPIIQIDRRNSAMTFRSKLWSPQHGNNNKQRPGFGRSLAFTSGVYLATPSLKQQSMDRISCQSAL